MIEKFTMHDILVRPMDNSDQEIVVELRNRPEIIQGLGESLSKFTNKMFVQELAMADEYAIERSGQVVGGILFNEILIDEGEIDDTGREISYYLEPNYWGLGIMFNSLNTLIKRLPKNGIDHLQAEVFLENQRSMDLLKRLNFVEEVQLMDPLALKAKSIWSLQISKK
ncbi:GNAT family N-acetyltransferase [Lentilactobacillus kosonis]|uniref:N-acetyltransferase domain-containing protein n=1 Tax=Lentilactobacillus kosonis TaxID=2810561 RepID=A0A401FLM5_9LACO|nr:GNAT family protein [Lentilactobacillus kosonis]GAY73292.1 hypothetical protein NBRC111893_1438 [Lentilactobacillus kosonis]